VTTNQIQPSQGLGNMRFVLIFLGLALAALGVLLWLFPAVHTKPAPDSAKCTNSSDCTVKVDDAPETLLTTLAVLGVVLVLIGANNRQITKFTAGDFGFETAATAATAAAEKAAQKTQTKVADLNAPGKEAAVLLAQSEARARVFRQAALSGGAVSSSDVEQIAQDAADVGFSSIAGNPSFE